MNNNLERNVRYAGMTLSALVLASCVSTEAHKRALEEKDAEIAHARQEAGSTSSASQPAMAEGYQKITGVDATGMTESQMQKGLVSFASGTKDLEDAVARLHDVQAMLPEKRLKEAANAVDDTQFYNANGNKKGLDFVLAARDYITKILKADSHANVGVYATEDGTTLLVRTLGRENFVNIQTGETTSSSALSRVAPIDYNKFGQIAAQQVVFRELGRARKSAIRAYDGAADDAGRKAAIDAYAAGSGRSDLVNLYVKVEREGGVSHNYNDPAQVTVADLVAGGATPDQMRAVLAGKIVRVERKTGQALTSNVSNDSLANGITALDQKYGDAVLYTIGLQK